MGLHGFVYTTVLCPRHMLPAGSAAVGGRMDGQVGGVADQEA